MCAVAVQEVEGMNMKGQARGKSYEGIGNSRDLSRRRIVRFLRASLICA
jgi:hypothetical protein